MNFRRAVAAKFHQASERVEKARAVFNFESIRAHISPKAKVLDVGAWSCYLAPLLRDRLGCDVLSLDVVNANKTDMPFQVFDGKTLPADSKSFDVILLLYVLHHAADDLRLLNEAHRVLRDGGRVLIAEDSVDGLWNNVVTVGFHYYLWLVTRMTVDGTFRTTAQWRMRFKCAGLEVKAIIPLGRFHGRRLFPNNILFVLEKPAPN